jgi:hypothetical protein
MTVDNYIEALPADRKDAILNLIDIFQKNLPQGFSLTISYGMIGFVVPHSLYPAGYHCEPKLPLPFINIASQKNFISIYHMGLYALAEEMEWFVRNYPLYTSAKLDMGKSCIRFKQASQIPFELFQALAQRISPERWIEVYENTYRKK